MAEASWQCLTSSPPSADTLHFLHSRGNLISQSHLTSRRLRSPIMPPDNTQSRGPGTGRRPHHEWRNSPRSLPGLCSFNDSFFLPHLPPHLSSPATPSSAPLPDPPPVCSTSCRPGHNSTAVFAHDLSLRAVFTVA